MTEDSFSNEPSEDYLPQESSGKRRRRRMLALAASIAACVCGVLTASLTFRSTLSKNLTSDTSIERPHAKRPYQESITNPNMLSLTQENEQFRKQVQLLNEQVRQKDRHLKDIQRQYHLQEKAIDSIRKSVQGKQNPDEEHAQYLAQIARDLRNTNENLEGELEKLRSQLSESKDAWESMLKNKETSFAALKDELQGKDSSLDELEGRYEQVLKSNEELTKRILKVENEKENFLQALQSREDKIRMISGELSGQSASSSELHTKVRELQSLLDETQNSLNFISSSKDQLEKDSKELIASLEQERQDLKEDLEKQKILFVSFEERSKQDLSEHKQNILNLKEQLSSLQNNLQKNQLDYQTLDASKQSSLEEKQEAIAMLEKELESLRKTHDEMQQNVLALQEENQSLSVEKQSLADSRDADLKSLQKSLDAQQEMLRTLEEKNQLLTQEKTDLTMRLENELHSLATDLHEQQRSNQGLNEEKRQILEEKDALYADLVKEIDAQSALLEEQGELNDGLEEKLALTEKERLELQTELSNLQSEKTEYLQTLQQQEEELQSYTMAMEKQTSAWDKLKNDHRQLIASLEEKEKDLLVRTEENDLLNERLKKFSSQVETFKDQAEERDRTEQKHLETIAVLTHSLEQERNVQASLEENVKGLTAKTADMEMHAAALKRQIENLENEKAKSLQERENLKVQVNNLHKEKNNGEIFAKGKTQELQTLQARMNSLEQSYAQKEEDYKKQIVQLKDNVTEENKRYTDQKRRFDDLAQTLKAQKKMLQTIEQSRTELATELDNIRESYRDLLYDVANKPATATASAVRKSPVAAAEDLNEKSLERMMSARTHIVSRGETLSDISMQYYGTSRRWQEIYEANRQQIPNQNVIKPGIKLIIP